MPTIALTKCQATGNDFVLFDERAHAALPYPQLARRLCDRRFGIGADGLLVLSGPQGASADLRMRIFNADGSEAEMCGNGIRCVWRYAAGEGAASGSLSVETAAGVVRVQADGPENVRVEMGVPLIDSRERAADVDGEHVSFTSVSMGNPHAVVFAERQPETIDLESVARNVARTAEASGINVEVVRLAAGRLHMRVHERGVGETWACGTGACAAAAAAIASGRTQSPVDVITKGGKATITWAGGVAPVYLSGPAHLVFDTKIDVDSDGLLSDDENAKIDSRLRTA
jgi:diaminopimelate epimerase